ncbi:hypothetical protein Ae201684_002269 [Aphanomyces euteiches]|uniref:Uncharacterized protein n=1 Tax=Aphanomyces euteiches TaxID=100861 RepID=A0A6G0XQS1_9STRA|nr:hypothetical protein Ae201684_002269 [Aphanomyces euteiches]
MDSIAEESEVVGSVDVSPSKQTKASHRRFWSVGVGGQEELQKIKKEQEVEILHSALEEKNKALEQSHEEAQLAARIGQSLLLQNQQLDYELEDKISQLTAECDDAKAQVKELEVKLQEANHQCRTLDRMRQQHEQELESLRDGNIATKVALKALKDELTHAKDKANATQTAHEQSFEQVRCVAKCFISTDGFQVEQLKSRLVELKQLNSKLSAEMTMFQLQADELKDANTELTRHVDELKSQSMQAAILSDKFQALQDEHLVAIQELEESKALVSQLQEENRSHVHQLAGLTSELQQATERVDHERQMAKELARKHEEWIQSGRRSSRELLKQDSRELLSNEIPAALEKEVANVTTSRLDKITKLAEMKELLAMTNTQKAKDIAKAQEEAKQYVAMAQVEMEAKVTELTAQLQLAQRIAKESELKQMVLVRDLESLRRLHEDEVEDTRLPQSKSEQTIHILREEVIQATEELKSASQRHDHEISELQKAHQELQSKYTKDLNAWKAQDKQNQQALDIAQIRLTEVEAAMGALAQKHKAVTAAFQSLEIEHKDVLLNYEATTTQLREMQDKLLDQTHQVRAIHL